MTRVLVVGGSGMLGHRIVLELAGEATLEVHATVRHSVPEPFRAAGVTYHEGVELSAGTAAVAQVLDKVRPDVLINAVGATKQKDLAATIDETYFLNGTLPHILAVLNPNPAARVIQVSTDCVFQGRRGGYRQDESPDATDLYGRSKAVGELAYGRHLTLRTSIVGFEIDGHLGLLSWLFRQPRGSRLPGYVHARYSGVTTGELSRTIVASIAGDAPTSGLWHVASEPISKFDLLTRIDAAFALGQEFMPDETLRVDRTLDDAPWRAATGTVRPSWESLVMDLQADWHKRPYADVYSRSASPAGVPGA